MKHLRLTFHALVIAACVCFAWIHFYAKLSISTTSSRYNSKFKPLTSQNKRVFEEESATWQNLIPRCENLLSNLTHGRWRRDPSGNVRYYDALYSKFWNEKKILKRFWRDDGKCGYRNSQYQIKGSTWPAYSSWCNPYGETPCCSNAKDGVCSLPSNSTCECKSCVDMTKYKYAEISRWETEDARCKWNNYSSTQACDVIRESPYDDIYFVGDSLMRNMFMAFIMLLSGDPVRGGWGKVMTKEQKKECVSEKFFFWGFCRKMIKSLDDLAVPEKLCGGTKLDFYARTRVYYDMDHSRHFLNLVAGRLGQNGALVLVGVGLHFKLRTNEVIDHYLDPALRLIEFFYRNKDVPPFKRWPRIFFILPLDPGLLKAKKHLLSGQNAGAISSFSSRMSKYCRQHEIPLFDFRQLSHHVHSFDGTHFGLGVNLMKNQILLNYLAGEA